MAILVSDLLRKLDAIPKSVLDDIKAEIQCVSYHENCYGDDYDDTSMVVSLEDVYKVLDKHIDNDMKYCPHCGAKMVEKQQREDT